MADQAVDSILTSATSLFAERGADSVSLLEIAKHANVSSGLIIYHFKSKNNLLFIVSRNILSRLYIGAASAMRSAKTPLSAINALIDSFFLFAEHNQSEILFLAKFDPYLRLNLTKFPEAELIVFKDQILGLIEEYVQIGISLKTFNYLVPGHFSGSVWAIIFGLCHTYRTSSDSKLLNAEINNILTYRLTGAL